MKKNSKEYVQAFLREEITKDIFQNYQIPLTETGTWPLFAKCLQKMVKEEIEISAESIFLESKSADFLCKYIDVLDRVDLENMECDFVDEKLVTEDYDFSHLENIAAEASRQLLLKMLEDIKKDHP